MKSSRGLVVSASASLLEDWSSNLGWWYYQIPGNVAFLPAPYTKELRGPYLQGSSHEGTSKSDDTRPCKNTVVALQVRLCHKAPSKPHVKNKIKMI